MGDYDREVIETAIAEQLGLAAPDCLPRPIRGLDAPARARVAEVVAALDLGTATG